MELRGLYVVGRFLGVEQRERADGSPVDGMFSVRVDAGREVFSLTYFAASRDGMPSRISQVLDDVEQGDRIAVKARVSVNRGYVNWDAVAVELLDAESVELEPVGA